MFLSDLLSRGYLDTGLEFRNEFHSKKRLNGMKLAYVLSHPIQYFSPLLRKLSNTPGIELIVYYGHNPDQSTNVDKGFGKVVRWDIPLLEGYNAVFLRNLARPTSLDNQFWALVNPGIVRALRRDKSDVVIVHGWSYFTNWLAVISAWAMGKKVWLRGENPYHQEIRKPKWLIGLKRIILEMGLFQLIDRFLYIGTENKKFYQFYGVKDYQLIYSPYAVNNSFFQAKFHELNGRKHEVRQNHGVALESVVVLFSGKFIEKKRPLDLIRVFAKLRNRNATLVMVGEGELRIEIQKCIQEKGLKNVILTGFINQNEISDYYAMADIFVLPSGTGETWGLVVNEAMNFQLPVVVSSTAGCAVDLVKEGQNGFVFTEGNLEQLECCLVSLIDDDKFRGVAGSNSKKIIEEFSYEAIIDNIVTALADASL